MQTHMTLVTERATKDPEQSRVWNACVSSEIFHALREQRVRCLFGDRAGTVLLCFEIRAERI